MNFKISNDTKTYFRALLLGWLLMIVFDLLIWHAVAAGLFHIAVPRLIATLGNLVFLMVAHYQIKKHMLAKQNQTKGLP